MKRKALKTAFPYTVPIFAGFWFLGLAYHEVTWHGGTVYVEDDFSNLLFAKDGEIYDLDGKKSIVIGGAYSVDKYYRLQRGMNWFPDEQPSDEIKLKTEKQLSAVNWNVDIVLTHTCPQKYVPIEAFLPGLDQSMVDHSIPGCKIVEIDHKRRIEITQL